MVRLTRVTGKCCILRYKDYCRSTVEASRVYNVCIHPTTIVHFVLLTIYSLILAIYNLSLAIYRDLRMSMCLFAGIAITFR